MPILGGAIGALAASLGSTLLPFRPYLAAASIGALGIGFFQAYRPERPCGPDDACKAPTPRRGMRILMWTVAAVVAATLTVQSWSSWLIYWAL